MVCATLILPVEIPTEQRPARPHTTAWLKRERERFVSTFLNDLANLPIPGFVTPRRFDTSLS
jgi:hypothetical protein